MVLPNDNSFEESELYLSKNYLRHISNTVCLESKEKIESIRRISLKIVDFIKEYSLNNDIDPLDMRRHHRTIKTNFINQYDDNKYPENMKRNRFVNLITEFFRMHETEIDDLLLRQDETDLFNTIKSTSRKSLDKLTRILNKYYCITFIENANKINQLNSINIHNPDAKLLDESYCLYISFNKIIYFITFDKDILEKYDLIQQVLNQHIHVTHPNYFN